MMKRLATIAAAILFTCSLGSNAFALSITDPGVLGTIKPGVPFGDGYVDDYVNYLLDMDLSSSETSGGQIYTRNDVEDPGSGSVTDSDMLLGTGTSVGEGWEYLIAKYNGPSGGAVVYYLGGEAFTLPLKSDPLWMNRAGTDGLGLSGWVAFNNVPDGGSTAALLGSVLVGFGILSRKFRRS